MNPQPGPVRHFDYIDGLRGFLAVYVAFHHFFGWNVNPSLPKPLRSFSSLFGFGHPAVCAFIVLSGFSLMLPVVASPTGTVRGGFNGYIRRRARRILPAYYASLAISCIAVLASSQLTPAVTNDVDWKSVTSHLLLVHTLLPGQTHTINSALWSVATEWHIYFLFPLVLLPVWRRCGTAALIFVAFGLGILPQLVLPAESDFLLACPWFVGLFAIGMVGAVMVDTPRSLNHKDAWPIVLGTVAVIAYLILKKISIGYSIAGWSSLAWLKDAMIGTAFACLLDWCTSQSTVRRVINQPKGVLLSVLESGIGKWLGSLSYSLYATHCAVVTIFNAIAHRFHFNPVHDYALKAMVGLPLAIGLAYVVSRWFEVPFMTKATGSSATTVFGGDSQTKAEKSIT